MGRWPGEGGVIKVEVQLHVVWVKRRRIWLRMLRLGLGLRVLLPLRVLCKLLLLLVTLLGMLLR